MREHTPGNGTQRRRTDFTQIADGGRPAINGDHRRATLTDRYNTKKAALDEAVNGAFEEALEAGSVERINALLSSLDRLTQALQMWCGSHTA